MTIVGVDPAQGTGSRTEIALPGMLGVDIAVGGRACSRRVPDRGVERVDQGLAGVGKPPCIEFVACPARLSDSRFREGGDIRLEVIGQLRPQAFVVGVDKFEDALVDGVSDAAELMLDCKAVTCDAEVLAARHRRPVDRFAAPLVRHRYSAQSGLLPTEKTKFAANLVASGFCGRRALSL